MFPAFPVLGTPSPCCSSKKILDTETGKSNASMTVRTCCTVTVYTSYTPFENIPKLRTCTPRCNFRHCDFPLLPVYPPVSAVAQKAEGIKAMSSECGLLLLELRRHPKIKTLRMATNTGLNHLESHFLVACMPALGQNRERQQLGALLTGQLNRRRQLDLTSECRAPSNLCLPVSIPSAGQAATS